MTPQLKIMAEIYWWSLCNEITFINQSACVGLFNKFYAFPKHSTWHQTTFCVPSVEKHCFRRWKKLG